MNRLTKRLGRLESKTLTNYAWMEEIPTPVLEAMVRRGFREGSHTMEEVALYRKIEEGGFNF